MFKVFLPILIFIIFLIDKLLTEKWHDKRTKKHRLILNVLVLFQFILCILTGLVVRQDDIEFTEMRIDMSRLVDEKQEADNLILDLKKQISSFEKKVMEYQQKEGASKLIYQSLGYLKPANEPDPPYPYAIRMTDYRIPPDAMKIFIGNNLCSTENIQKLAVIRLDGQDMLTLNKDSEGLTISAAQIFREDGVKIVNIVDNQWASNPNIYFKPLIPDPHQVELINNNNKTILKVRFINENTIKVEGVFYYPGHKPIIISDAGINYGKQRMSGSLIVNAHNVCLDYNQDSVSLGMPL